MAFFSSTRCRSCHVKFISLQGQRDHYKSDWHKCNVTRKVSEIPPLQEDDFNKRVGQIKSLQMQALRLPMEKHHQQNLIEKHHLGTAQGASPATTTASQLTSIEEERLQKALLMPFEDRSVSSTTKPSGATFADKSQASARLGYTLNLAKMTEEEQIDYAMKISMHKCQPLADGMVVEIADVDLKKEHCRQREEQSFSNWILSNDDEEGAMEEWEGEINPSTDCLICDHRSTTLEMNIYHMSTSHYFKLQLEYSTVKGKLVECLAEKCQISVNDNKVNSELLLKNCQEHEWDKVLQFLKHSTDYGEEVLTKALMIAKSDSQWNIIHEILKCDVFDKDVILLILYEAFLENQHDLVAHLGVLYDVDVFPQVLQICEGRGNWEMIMTILNLSLDIDEHVLNKVLISASDHQQWHIVNKVLQSDVELQDIALENVLESAILIGKLDLIGDISKRYSHIISEKVLLQATKRRQWKFLFIVLKSQKEFRRETLADVFREAFINMDIDIMHYFFTQDYNGDLINFDTLKDVYGKICLSKQELAKKVAFLMDSKVKCIINPFKMTTPNNPLGSIWSHHLDGNIQVSEICAHSVSDYCRLECSGCPRLHATENYHWQISFTGNYWINLTKSQSQCIEETFCNPCFDYCFPFSNFKISNLSMQEKGIVNLLGHENIQNWVVDFKNNLISNHSSQAKKCNIKHKENIFIRRLEVKNSDADQYQWYFQENSDIWVKYGNRETIQDTAKSTKDQFHRILGASKDLGFFKQTNKKTGMKRFFKRRPKRHQILSLCNLNKIVRPDRPSLLVRFDIQSGEYKEIFEKLNHLIKGEGSSIESVVKVNNIHLNRAFKIRLEMIERYNTDICKQISKQVCHGTKKEFVENIIRKNFDWRLYGKRFGHNFGQGVYFTTEPKYAIKYATPDCGGKRYLIFSSIIVSNMTEGHKNMEKPPINPLNNIPYDTSVNNLISPSIYVKYNNQEICPEYVVTFRCKKMGK